MVGIFTSLQLIRYIYHECSSTESQILEEYMLTDRSAFQELQELTAANRFLPKALFSAHPNSIENILDYSSHFKA